MELRSGRRGRRSGSCCCSITECRYGVAVAHLSQCLCVCPGCYGVGDVVFGVLLSLYLSWGWGRDWEQAKSSGSITSVLSGAPEWLIVAGCLRQALSPGIRLPAQGMSQVLALHLGRLLGDCVHVYLLASVFCFLSCAAALSPR